MIGRVLMAAMAKPTGNATPGDVVAGVTFYSDDPKEKQTGTLELTGTAVANDVVEGKTFYSINPKQKITGGLTANGAVNVTIDPGESYTIPWGYHNGGGKVTANAGGYPGLPSGYKYVTGSKTMAEVNASATTFPMSISFSGGGFQTPYAQEGTGQVLFGSTVVYAFTISGGGNNNASGGMAYIDVFAACGRSFSTLMSGNQQLSLSGFSSGTLTVTAWIEPV